MNGLQTEATQHNFGFNIGDLLKVKTSDREITYGILRCKSKHVFCVETKWGYREAFSYNDHAVGLISVSVVE